jgi:membrane-associated phospholipid phosphatase
MQAIFYKFWKNLGRCFWGYNLLWQGLAILLTYIIVASGFDWVYYQNTQVFYSYAFPAAAIGGLFPIIIPLILLLIGRTKKNFQIKNTAYALAQAAILGVIISSFYKALTGRAHPMMKGDVQTDITQIFHFGFFNNGIFWGWPSSHTTIAFAMGITLFILYRKNFAVKYLALIYAIYIGLGVSMTIHWFSDFAAGAIFGTIIGVVVGKSFKYSYENIKNLQNYKNTKRINT